jgi:hypothetical protein
MNIIYTINGKTINGGDIIFLGDRYNDDVSFTTELNVLFENNSIIEAPNNIFHIIEI